MSSLSPVTHNSRCQWRHEPTNVAHLQRAALGVALGQLCFCP